MSPGLAEVTCAFGVEDQHWSKDPDASCAAAMLIWVKPPGVRIEEEEIVALPRLGMLNSSVLFWGRRECQCPWCGVLGCGGSFATLPLVQINTPHPHAETSSPQLPPKTAQKGWCWGSWAAQTELG